MEIGGELAGHDEKLVVDDIGKRNGAAGGNQVRAPLKNEASVPEREDGEKDKRGGEGGAAGAEGVRRAVGENGGDEGEKRGGGEGKTGDVGRDAGPNRARR